MRNLYLFVIFLVIYESSTYISNDMIMPGMLNVVTELHSSIKFVSLSFTIYILGNCLLQLFVAPLSERFGKRNVILTGSLLFMLFTILIVLSRNIYEFMSGRLLQGSGMAFIAIGYALIHEKFNDKQAVRIFSVMNNIGLLSPLFGPILGAIIIQMANWRYIFVVTGVFALISFIGLYLFTPKCPKKTPIRFNMRNTGRMYLKIFLSTPFIIGTSCISLSLLPGLCWIGLSPTIIMKTLKLSMKSYVIYQLIAIGGLVLSNIVIYVVAGRINFYRLIKTGSVLAFIGLAVSLVFNTNLNIVVSGMFVYSFGLGIFNTLIMHLVMGTPGLPQDMLTSLMVFIETIIFVVGIEIANQVCYYFDYSLYGLTLINVIVACLFTILATVYANINKGRSWS